MFINATKFTFEIELHFQENTSNSKSKSTIIYHVLMYKIWKEKEKIEYVANNGLNSNNLDVKIDKI